MRSQVKATEPLLALDNNTPKQVTLSTIRTHLNSYTSAMYDIIQAVESDSMDVDSETSELGKRKRSDEDAPSAPLSSQKISESSQVTLVNAIAPEPKKARLDEMVETRLSNDYSIYDHCMTLFRRAPEKIYNNRSSHDIASNTVVPTWAVLRPWLNNFKRVVFLDLETTGLDIKKAKIVEVGLIILEGDATPKYVSVLVNPGMSIPQEATRVHHISDYDVSFAPKFYDYSLMIANYLRDACVIGYNIKKFDLPILRREIEDCGDDLRHRYEIDLMEELKERTTYKLSLWERLILGRSGNPNAHTALADAEICYAILATIAVDSKLGWQLPMQ
jgi:uncharacterized protein YprB with RNaseH-like and TPR domain